METGTLAFSENKEIYGISHLSVMVPYRRPGNVIEHLPVDFSVHHTGDKIKAIPLCDESVRRLTGLPNPVLFEVQNGHPVSHRSDLLDVAEEIFQKLNSRIKLSSVQ